MNLHASSGPMLEWLKALAARFRAQQPPYDRPLDDPFSGVRAPRPHGPSDRATGAAVTEPQSDERVTAVGGAAKPHA